MLTTTTKYLVARASFWDDMTVLQTNGLTKRYGSFVAVEELNLSIGDGEIYGFLGPNGAGKSTTIDLLLGFSEPTEGTVELFGRNPTAAPTAVRSQIGLLPEGATPYENLTGRKHVEFAADAKNVEVDASALIDRVGLSQADADRPAGDYSKGMSQRLGLAMALVGDPDLLVLDEPSSGLDPTGMAELRELIRAEADAGTAVLFSSHILEEVEAVCDRVGILDDGRLVAQDTVDALRGSVTERNVVELSLGEPPTDFGLESLAGVGRIEVDGRTVRVTCETPTAKGRVIAHVHERAELLDVVTSGSSLEEVFAAYAGEEAPA